MEHKSPLLKNGILYDQIDLGKNQDNNQKLGAILIGKETEKTNLFIFFIFESRHDEST